MRTYDASIQRSEVEEWAGGTVACGDQKKQASRKDRKLWNLEYWE